MITSAFVALAVAIGVVVIIVALAVLLVFARDFVDARPSRAWRTAAQWDPERCG